MSGPGAERLEKLLQRVRELTEYCKRRHNDFSKASDAFRELVQLLLSLTVLESGASVRKVQGPNRSACVLRAHGHDHASLPLRNRGFLRYSVHLFLDPTTRWLKVSKANYQYQLDEEGERWVFRYEYIREPGDKHPAAHLHVRGKLTESCLPKKELLEHLHFPTHRVSLEAVIRLLVDHFKVPCNEREKIWRPVLLESEAEFLRIAHPPTNSKQGDAR